MSSLVIIHQSLTFKMVHQELPADPFCKIEALSIPQPMQNGFTDLQIVSLLAW